MTGDEDLDAISTALEHAQAQREAAAKALAKDKWEREGSAFAQLIDVLTTTDAEAAAAEAEGEFIRVRLEGRNKARAWIMAEAKRAISRDPLVAARHDDLAEAYLVLKTEADQLTTWLGLAEMARIQLDETLRICRAAAGMEAVDLIGDNGLHVLWSDQQTREAIDAMIEGDRVIAALNRALPDRIKAEKTAQPNANWDLAADMLGSPGFDVTSLMNLQRLRAAIEKYEAASAEIQVLWGELHGTDAAAKAKAHEAKRVLSAIEEAYLNAAAQRVPEALRDEVPTGISH